MFELFIILSIVTGLFGCAKYISHCYHVDRLAYIQANWESTRGLPLDERVSSARKLVAIQNNWPGRTVFEAQQWVNLQADLERTLNGESR